MHFNIFFLSHMPVNILFLLLVLLLAIFSFADLRIPHVIVYLLHLSQTRCMVYVMYGLLNT